jgi:hypothetical protein
VILVFVRAFSLFPALSCAACFLFGFSVRFLSQRFWASTF